MYLLSYKLLANWLTIVRGLLRALRKQQRQEQQQQQEYLTGAINPNTPGAAAIRSGDYLLALHYINLTF